MRTSPDGWRTRWVPPRRVRPPNACGCAMPTVPAALPGCGCGGGTGSGASPPPDDSRRRHPRTRRPPLGSGWSRPSGRWRTGPRSGCPRPGPWRCVRPRCAARGAAGGTGRVGRGFRGAAGAAAPARLVARCRPRPGHDDAIPGPGGAVDVGRGRRIRVVELRCARAVPAGRSCRRPGHRVDLQAGRARSGATYGLEAERRLREAAAGCGRARVLDPLAAELLRFGEVREEYAKVTGATAGARVR